MTDLTLSFPKMPENAEKSITRPSKQFKKSVYKVVVAIISFVVVYILLLISATAIALAMGWLGVMIILALKNFVVLLLGLGLILSGLMLAFFLVKFIFAKREKAITGHEIKEHEHPELFGFIRKVTDEVGTNYPKHVYLTNEVNASASFRPNFWSLFLPIRKNLTIGLGLVNSINQSEFKTVLAHEFGHFSQRSMRFGGYVYHLNRALYNLLYENTGYHKALNAWGSRHWALRFAAMINIYIIRCIQEILRKMYIFINKSHMQLSRQMEFHADTIAAYASGGNNVVSSLRRIEIGDMCYNQMFGIINSELSEKQRPANIYELHSVFLKNYANDYGLPTDKCGLPIVGKKIDALDNVQITLDNQWASHPDLEDRENNVDRLNLHSPIIYESAWELFNKPQELQKYFSDLIYEGVSSKEELAIVDIRLIEEHLENKKNANSFNKLYKGFYDSRLLTVFNFDEALTENTEKDLKHFNDLFTDENSNVPRLSNAINLDITKLDTLIESKSDDIRSFDFKGITHYPKDAENIKEQLANALKEKESELENLDKNAFRMFYNAASTDELKKELISHYEKVFKYQTEAIQDFGNYNMVMNAVRPVYTQMSFKDIYATVDRIYAVEKNVKTRMTEVLAEPATQHFIDETQAEVLEKYLKNKYIYFLEPKYDNQALGTLNSAMNIYIDVLYKRNHQFKKDLFDFQLTLID
ncbi:M48 family metallopeptidase [Mucilaginibacter sp. BT774]|uniref:M48 family metallopeptidase n=1 Tax=Mucilaginibacter sp. BT774 TaxID=3062276 RepID=UPI0026748EBE|nr:M48 family metallopeptidase [Mucilaginibacter sp. BT774]MDO3624910.1 M48 family metalloprotease [Mucilaginibacter sp. BT774]